RDIKAGFDPDTAFHRLGKNLNYEYGAFFAQLLRLAWDDASVAQQFPKLAIKIKRHEELMAVNDTSLAWMRVVGIFLNA
ncbi:hypothetical protein, partial [Desulfocucumis palustris]|uniref:hypothetical protein n=1 Tax=Desulfocucumis palustris TaxID=1898651 RepID=UPI0013FDD703